MNLKPLQATKPFPQPGLVRAILASILIFALAGIAGCGKKGPLQLPKNSAQNIIVK